MIHASKWFDEKQVRRDFATALEIALATGAALPPVTLQAMQAMGGHLVGQAVVTASVSASSNPWFFGPRALLLDQVQPLARPIPCRGMQGLFDVSDVMRQAGRVTG